MKDQKISAWKKKSGYENHVANKCHQLENIARFLK